MKTTLLFIGVALLSCSMLSGQIKNASDYGFAPGNTGIANAQALIAAMNAHRSGNLDVLQINEGTFQVSDTVNIAGWDGLQIIGSGNTTISTNANLSIFIARLVDDPVRNGTIKDLKLESTYQGTQDFGNNPGLFFLGNIKFSDFVFDNVEFTAPNANINGIYVSNSSGSNITERITIKNCHFHHLGRMGMEFFNSPLDILDLTSRFESIFITDNYFEHLGLLADSIGRLHGIAISFGGVGKSSTVSNNIFGKGIPIINIEATGMDGLIIGNNGHLGSPGSMYQFTYPVSKAKNITITNDRAFDHYYTSSYIQNVENLTIENSKLYGGISFGRDHSTAGEVRDVWVRNSTIISNFNETGQYGAIALTGKQAIVDNINFENCNIGELTPLGTYQYHPPVIFTVGFNMTNINFSGNCLFQEPLHAGSSVAINFTNNTSDCEEVFSEDTEPPVPALLAASSVGNNSVDLYWTDATDNEGIVKYTLYQNGAHGIDLPPNASTYTVGGLIAGGTYNFMIRAYDAAGNQSNSNDLRLVPGNTPDGQKPTTPILSAQTVGQTSVDLYWTPSVDNIGINRYMLYMNGAHGVELSPTATSHTVTGLAPGGTYVFMIRAYDPNGNQRNSNDLAIVPGNHQDTFVPTAPELSAKKVTSTAVDLYWSAAYDNYGINRYELYVDGSLVQSFSPNEHSYSVMGLTLGAAYDFRLKAVDANGNATDSPVLSITLGSDDSTPPTAPVLGISNVNEDAGSVQLRWIPASDNIGVSKYVLYTNGGLPITLPPTVTSYNRNFLVDGFPYTFMVRAFDDNGNQMNSNDLNIVFGNINDTQSPSSPVLSSPDHNSTSIQLSWTDAQDNIGIAKYVVYFNGGNPVELTPNVTDYTKSLLPPGNYCVKVRAFDIGGNTADSNELCIDTNSGSTTLMAQLPVAESTSASGFYPNPTTHSIHIALPELQDGGSYTLFDIQGNRLRTARMAGETVSLSGLPNGIYFVKVFDRGKEVKTVKVIKK